MPLPLHDAPLRAPFPIGTMTFCVAAINRFVDQMLLAQGPYRNCLMFDLHKTECFNELAKLLESLPASSHDTSQSPVFYTTAVTKALRIPLTKKIGKRINETSKKFVREPSAPPPPGPSRCRSAPIAGASQTSCSHRTHVAINARSMGSKKILEAHQENRR